MLGVFLKSKKWKWAAFGKHPSLKDYFYYGEDDPLFLSIQSWIDRGYQETFNRLSQNPLTASWRFWIKNPSRHFIACGVVRDSSDSLGRRYPICLIGYGYLNQWENHLPLVPVVCEKTWSDMEYITRKESADYIQLKNKMRKISAPLNHWKAFSKQIEDHQSNHCFISRLAEKQLHESRLFEYLQKRLESKKSFILSVRDTANGHVWEIMTLFHSFYDHHFSDIPNAVFMGGRPNESYISVFRKALSIEDFKQLWLINRSELEKYGSLVFGKNED
jgi:hypothetical protein